eukprot:4436309-Pleurochrysis_carterae.AAC.1
MIIANALASRIALNSARILPANSTEPTAHRPRPHRPQAYPADASLPVDPLPQMPESSDNPSRPFTEEPA